MSKIKITAEFSGPSDNDWENECRIELTDENKVILRAPYSWSREGAEPNDLEMFLNIIGAVRNHYLYGDMHGALMPMPREAPTPEPFTPPEFVEEPTHSDVDPSLFEQRGE